MTSAPCTPPGSRHLSRSGRAWAEPRWPRSRRSTTISERVESRRSRRRRIERGFAEGADHSKALGNHLEGDPAIHGRAGTGAALDPAPAAGDLRALRHRGKSEVPRLGLGRLGIETAAVVDEPRPDPPRAPAPP